MCLMAETIWLKMWMISFSSVLNNMFMILLTSSYFIISKSIIIITCSPDCLPCKRLGQISSISIFHLNHQHPVALKTMVRINSDNDDEAVTPNLS